MLTPISGFGGWAGVAYLLEATLYEDARCLATRLVELWSERLGTKFFVSPTPDERRHVARALDEARVSDEVRRSIAWHAGGHMDIPIPERYSVP